MDLFEESKEVDTKILDEFDNEISGGMIFPDSDSMIQRKKKKKNGFKSDISAA